MGVSRMYAWAPLVAALVMWGAACTASDNDTSNGGGDDGGGGTPDGATTREPPTSPDAAESDAPGDDAGTDAADAADEEHGDTDKCSTLEPGGALVSLVVSSAAAPSTSGGTLANGTYELTATRWHTSSFPDGTTFGPNQRVSLVVTGSALEARSVDDEDFVESTSGTVATAGSTFTFTPSCGDGIGNALAKTAMGSSTSFTFDGTTLTLVMTGPTPGSIEAVYTKK